MAKPSQREVVRALLERHGRTHAQDLGVDVSRNTPSPLFRLLIASLLFSARISSNVALEAARALAEKGWTTAPKMAGSTWSQRTKTLNRAGYARYDESTSRMIGESTDLLLERWGGDLRKLRAEADRDPDQERPLLKAFKGIGDRGVDIFFREVQVAWDEIRPFADRPALDAAERLGLPADPGKLEGLVSRKDFPRLVAALVRTGIEQDFDQIQDQAAA
ncbi:MAG TPA: hypothetical protein VE646_05990 [Actinomycetota bacterium]|nr:hypothetical protein [Actinomycetota bacterium]